ncbi:MAG: AAA family ATPase [Desulfurococcales archaeon]|nr:AAA family ATPase [Desulfurococcales archaeon]
MRGLPRRADKGEHNRGPIVVVSGPPGSGKTTYARRLSKDLGLEYYTTGSIFRSIAKEKGMSLEELSRLASSDPTIDLVIDRRTINIALNTMSGIVIDSHLAAWILSRIADVAVLVKADPLTRVRRIGVRDGKSYSRALEETFERETSQWDRFYKLYGIDILDYTVFDLVVDSSVLGPEKIYSIIKLFVEEKLRLLGYGLPA